MSLWHHIRPIFLGLMILWLLGVLLYRYLEGGSS